jgi:dTDP-4-dehydrorhamnose reductase
MEKILVTGCQGQLGRAIQTEYETDTAALICTGRKELDITDIDAVMRYVRELSPAVIINCAAYTAVDDCETNRELAYRVNAIGPRNLAIAARAVGAKLIHISTDYVFDGKGKEPYTEFDATGPVSVYGKSKLAGEEFVRQFAGRYFILRTAWLYGDGKNFVKTMLRLAENQKKVRVVSDQVGSPTSAGELAKLIHVLEPTDNYGLFHATCEGSCSWAEFAAEIFRLAGTGTEVEPITTAEYGSPVERPANSVLDNYMLRLTTDYKMADWQQALQSYMGK